MLQITHRTIAVLLLLHLIGVVVALGRRADDEAPIVVRTARIALGLVLLQLAVASAMILFHLPAVLRSLHEATGVAIWLSCFLLADLARRTAPIPKRATETAAQSFAAGVPPRPATDP